MTKKHKVGETVYVFEDGIKKGKIIYSDSYLDTDEEKRINLYIIKIGDTASYHTHIFYNVLEIDVFKTKIDLINNLDKTND